MLHLILISSMQPLLVLRFLINLRQVNPSSISELDSSDRGHTHLSASSVKFRGSTTQSVIGNMGESLDDGLQDSLEEDGVDELTIPGDIVDNDIGAHSVCYDIKVQ